MTNDLPRDYLTVLFQGNKYFRLPDLEEEEKKWWGVDNSPSLFSTPYSLISHLPPVFKHTQAKDSYSTLKRSLRHPRREQVSVQRRPTLPSLQLWEKWKMTAPEYAVNFTLNQDKRLKWKIIGRTNPWTARSPNGNTWLKAEVLSAARTMTFFFW